MKTGFLHSIVAAVPAVLSLSCSTEGLDTVRPAAAGIRDTLSAVVSHRADSAGVSPQDSVPQDTIPVLCGDILVPSLPPVVKYGCMPLQLAVSVPSALRKDEIRAEGSDLCRACRDGAGYVRVIPEGVGRAQFRVSVPGEGPELLYNDFSFDVEYDARFLLRLVDTTPQSPGNDGLVARLTYTGLVPCVTKDVEVKVAATRGSSVKSKVLYRSERRKWDKNYDPEVTLATYQVLKDFYEKYPLFYDYSLLVTITTDDPWAEISFEDLGCAAASGTYGGKKLTLKFNGTSL